MMRINHVHVVGNFYWVLILVRFDNLRKIKSKLIFQFQDITEIAKAQVAVLTKIVDLKQ